MPNIIFGMDVPAELAVGDPVENARRAEALGFEFISTNDHVLGTAPRNEGWTLLTWLAQSTTRIRIASRVLGVPYRQPVLLAKMAETLDRLSGGRLILGLGAGSGEREFTAMGLPDATVRSRVDALEEAIDIVTSLWRQPSVTYEGERYVARDAAIEPRPDHPIPIWLGTAGPRGLALVGKRADGWVPSLPYAPPDRAPGMIAQILAAATEAGRDPAAIHRIYNLRISLIAGVAAEVAGSPEQISERLVEFLGMGFTGFNFSPVGPDREGQIEQLTSEVIPAVRAAVA
jgi:probable F420-dependent oxidoreductase